MLPKNCPRHIALFPKGAIMDYYERLEKLDKHIAEHPKDYQSVIARLKTYSDAVDHEMYLRKIARIKKVERYRNGGK